MLLLPGGISINGFFTTPGPERGCCDVSCVVHAIIAVRIWLACVSCLLDVELHQFRKLVHGIDGMGQVRAPPAHDKTPPQHTLRSLPPPA